MHIAATCLLAFNQYVHESARWIQRKFKVFELPGNHQFERKNPKVLSRVTRLQMFKTTLDCTIFPRHFEMDEILVYIWA